VSDGQTGVRTFLIADVRGYTRYTEEYGDEAAAELAARFAELVAEGVNAHDGKLVEIRGDEALAVFTSARQAIRAAVDLQAQFNDPEFGSDLPLKVGVGIDSGEAVQLKDESYRGAALNVAARLCGRAHGGEVLLSEATSRLAGRLGGLHYSDRGRVRLKNIPEPIHILQVYSELDARPQNRWIVMFFGSTGRSLTWKVGALAAVIAAATAAGVVYLTAGGSPQGGNASPPLQAGAGPSTPPTGTRAVTAATIVPAGLWKDCKLQAVPDPTAVETAVCVPGAGPPDRWQLSTYKNSAQLAAAYNAELRLHYKGKRDGGTCNQLSWGGEHEWLHGPGKPGGRMFCYFDGNDAVIVWTHARRGQPTHRDILGIAREGGSDHVSLTNWWRPWHHIIGKVQ
jgi:class 3 adenylate cyclase